MIKKEELIELLRNGDKYFMSELAIDCVIFGYHNKQLKVLIGKFASLESWGLPGGFIKKEEPISAAAARILKELTTLEDIFLQQFYTFGDTEVRVQGSMYKLLPPELLQYAGENNWLRKRIITVGYYALIDFLKAQVKPGTFYKELHWQNVTELPELQYDHNEIVEKALATLRNQIYLQPIGYNLLPEKFTLPEIQALYETILGKNLNRRNFPTKLTSLGIIEK